MDIFLALSFVALSVPGMTSAVLAGREMFESAKDKSLMMDAFELHRDFSAGMLPYETRSASYTHPSSTKAVVMDATARWYGNDRIETGVKITYGSRELSFVMVRNHPDSLLGLGESKSVCSPILTSSYSVGSYGFLKNIPDEVLLEVSPITLPTDPLLPLTDLEVRNGIAYISADSTVSSDPDFVVVDISDKDNPGLLGQINTGPGISSFVMAGGYAYGAATSISSQLHILDVEDTSTLRVVHKYKLPLPEASSTPPIGSSIEYDRGKIYLGSEKWVGEEVSVIDAASPEEPVKIGGFETDSKVNEIVVSESGLYLGASDEKQFRILDVTNPANPTERWWFAPSGWQRQGGKTISIFEDSLTLGRTSGGFDIKTDHEMFHWKAATNTPHPPEESLNIPGGVYGAILDRDYTILISRTPDEELQIFSIVPDNVPISSCLACGSPNYYL